MKRQLFWKLSGVFTLGAVVLFYLISYLLVQTEKELSLIKQAHRDELNEWGKQAEQLYQTNDRIALEQWLTTLEEKEHTRAKVVQHKIKTIAGYEIDENEYNGFNFGRNVDWQIHLYFKRNPIMEIPFSDNNTSLLVELPERMRPGNALPSLRLTLQVFIPVVLLSLLSWLLYRHIMQPLAKLQQATTAFSHGDFSVRLRQGLGKRNDELSELANTFDQMASRIGELIASQRQLIADMSHELRTPLARLDMAVESAQRNDKASKQSLQRVSRESQNIRRLVEDSLTLSWLENEQPILAEEDLDLIDLLDVIIEDAKFEFPNKLITTDFPNSAQLNNSNHRAVGQALENIIRNALRFTPRNGFVELILKSLDGHYLIEIKDQGPGVPEDMLEAIFKPFFRLDKSRTSDTTSFGLGLALARRQLHTVGGTVRASNQTNSGLCMRVTLPHPPRQSRHSPVVPLIASHM